MKKHINALLGFVCYTIGVIAAAYYGLWKMLVLPLHTLAVSFLAGDLNVTLLAVCVVKILFSTTMAGLIWCIGYIAYNHFKGTQDPDWVLLFFQHSVRAGFAVITPRVLLAVTMTVFATLHAEFVRFRVIVRVGHACTELDKQGGPACRHHRSNIVPTGFHRHGNIIRAVINGLRELDRSSFHTLLRHPVAKDRSSLLKPGLSVLGFPYQLLNPSPGERNIDRLTHDTVTLLTA